MSRIKCINNFCFHIFFPLFVLFLFHFSLISFSFLCLCVCVCVCLCNILLLWFLIAVLENICDFAIDNVYMNYYHCNKNKHKIRSQCYQKKKNKFSFTYIHIVGTMKDFLFYFKLRTFFVVGSVIFCLFYDFHLRHYVLKGETVSCWFFSLFIINSYRFWQFFW